MAGHCQRAQLAGGGGGLRLLPRPRGMAWPRCPRGHLGPLSQIASPRYQWAPRILTPNNAAAPGQPTGQRRELFAMLTVVHTVQAVAGHGRKDKQAAVGRGTVTTENTPVEERAPRHAQLH